jgi:prepilin-type N-terminal cleavage/methylation domain-containing protein
MKWSRHGGHGFSLVELLAVVAILGLLAGLGIPALIQNHKREQLNALTIGLAFWLQEVRRSALRGNTCEVKISTGLITDGGTVASIDGEPIPQTCAIPNNPYLLTESAMGAAYEIAANEDTFSFTPRGSKFPSTDVLITIGMANSGPARCIQLNGLLGNLEMGNASNGSCVLTKF